MDRKSRKTVNTEKHPFEPFLPEGAHILFLGSFPPQQHRWCMPFYYPNWINDFWRIMGLIHFGDKDHFTIPAQKRFDEASIRAFCTQQGIALYDTASEVRRLKDNASDAFLEVVTPTDIPDLLRQIPHCHTLVTTGQKATEVVAQAFGCPIPPVGGWVTLRPDQASAGPTVEGNSTLTSPTHADAIEVRFWRMPSTSRAYPMPLEKKAEAYRKLFTRHKKLILWDLDGTLIDTLEDLAAAVNHALELRDLPLHSVADYRKMVGHGVRNLVTQALEASLKETPDQVGGDKSAPVGDGGAERQQLRASGSRWLKEIGFSGTVPKNNFIQPQGRQLLTDAYIDAALADFKEYYKAHIDVHTRPYEGMQELLTELQAEGVKMAVASNKFQEGTEHLIREFFPDIQFVAILGNRPGYPLKPDPEIVQEVLAKAAVSPNDAIMVGDSPTDMRTAANGGIDAVAVSWGYRTVEELSGNRIVHTVEELQRIL